MSSADRGKQLLDALQSDLHALCGESRRKSDKLKQSAERALLKLRGIAATAENGAISNICASLRDADDVLGTFLLGCEETKHPRIMQLSTSCILRLIENHAVGPEAVEGILDTLWRLMATGQEELKILQCALSLVSTVGAVAGDQLAKVIVICFRLHFNKDVTTTAIGAATLRQVVGVVFDRVDKEDDKALPSSPLRQHPKAPKNLNAGAADAFLLFQDLCLLTNGESPHWLHGMQEMTRTFGLELIETALTTSPDLFFRHPEFSYLLKERVCALVIKLFSPTIKHAGRTTQNLVFPVTVRLMRVMSALIRQFHPLLSTECEIFLSMLVRFMDPDKPYWQRVLAIEVIHQICQDPGLVCSFCRYYDMQPHSTKIFRDLISAVGGAVQSIYQSATEKPAISLPTARQSLLDMLEKVDAPMLSESVGISIGFACLVDVIKTISSIVTLDIDVSVSQRMDKPVNQAAGTSVASSPTSEELELWRSMVESSWCGLLPALSLVLRLSSVPQTTEAVLRAFTSFTRVCGVLHLATPRDSFITGLCTSCLPEHYNMSQEPSGKGWQVSDKNLQCVHALLKLAMCLGPIIEGAWHAIIVTMQQLISILNPPHPVTGGSQCQFAVKKGVQRSNSASVLASTPSSELSVLGAMMVQLFEASQHLCDPALQHLISALCRVSEETLDQVATSSSANHAIYRHDAHLLPVIKIWEVGLVNLDRIMVFWPTVTAHLIEVAGQSHPGLRAVALETLTRLVHAALAHPRVPVIQDNPGLQQAILSPLRNLASCENVEARKRQLECVYQVLDSSGTSLAHAWPVVIGIINDSLTVSNPPSSIETVRIALDSLRMVVNDFLPTVPLWCYPLLLEALGGFGAQELDVNVSLTAMGLLWNVSDYISQHNTKINEDLAAPGCLDDDAVTTPAGVSVTPQALWMALFTKLADLCTDRRPEVRKSANQTLTSTITTHGLIFPPATWHAFLWNVLFPLVDRVRQAEEDALEAEEQPINDMMVHHSRNSPKKQWAETRVLVLQGMTRVFNAFFNRLLRVKEFLRAWTLALDFIQDSSSSQQDEVCLAAVKAFLELVRPAGVGPEESDDGALSDSQDLWVHAWQTWCGMASYALRRSPIPKRTFLAVLVESFGPLFLHMQAVPGLFTVVDARRMLPLVRGLMNLQHHDCLVLSQLSDLQAVSLQAVLCLAPTDGGRHNKEYLPQVLRELALYASYGCAPPPPAAGVKPGRAGVCVTLAVAALEHLSRLFTRYCDTPAVIHERVAEAVLDVLRVPLVKKYSCPSVDFWRQCVHAFVSIVHSAIQGSTLVYSFSDDKELLATLNQKLWQAIVQTLDAALGTPTVYPEHLSQAEIQADAALDIELVQLVRDILLLTAVKSEPAASGYAAPVDQLQLLCHLLRKGAQEIFTPEDGMKQSVGRWADRRHYARECLDVLLNSAPLQQLAHDEMPVAQVVDRIFATVTCFLQRLESSVEAALPAVESSQVVFAITTLSAIVAPQRRELSLRLYPLLIKCVAHATPEMRQPLADTLLAFYPLL